MKLEIFILCHDRPAQAQEAILSVFEQNSSNYRLIVSDNSANDGVQEMVRAHFPSATYRRRPADMPALDHFNTCISEAQAEYFCLFHDDDRMHENFVAETEQAIAAHPGAVAFGTNACVEHVAQNSRTPSFSCFGAYERIPSPPDLFRRYFGRHHTGIAPFPGYVYKTAPLVGMRIPAGGGKYADVSWLLQVSARGAVIWIAAPLFDYRIHGGNDGLQESRRDRLSFLAFLKQHKELCGEAGLADYRFFLYKKVLASLSGHRFSRRSALLTKYLRRYRVARFLRTSDYGAMIHCVLLKKIIRKKACA